MVENFLIKLLPEEAGLRCRLSSTLTDKGDISLVLEAMDSKHGQQCSIAAKELVQLVNKPPKTLITGSIISKMGAAAEGKKISKTVLDTVKNAKPEKEKKHTKTQESPSSEIPSSGSLHVLSIVTVVIAVALGTIAVV